MAVNILRDSVIVFCPVFLDILCIIFDEHYKPQRTIFVLHHLSLCMRIMVKGSQPVSCPIYRRAVRVSLEGIHQNKILKIFQFWRAPTMNEKSIWLWKRLFFWLAMQSWIFDNAECCMDSIKSWSCLKDVKGYNSTFFIL